jgi:gentisate 1,2-dioxygenase
MISERSELMVDVSGTGYATPERWKPIVVPHSEILAEIERLASEAQPANGRRAALIVHPQSTKPGLGFAPGIDVTINVLKPGEETVPVRRNSNQLEIVIGGTGTVYVGKQEFAVERNDIWNMPAMQTYRYKNTGKDLFARLSYSNAPLLEKLGAHYFEENPAPIVIDTDVAQAVQQKRTYARENAPDFAITPEGARMRGYEFLVDIEVLESKAILWPWKATYPHMKSSGNAEARQIVLLYNPATERRNGTTHSFFATLAGKGPNTDPPPIGRGHRHSSVAINYYFHSSGGKSIVDGVTYDWGAGDLMLSAPSWSEHAHYVNSSPIGNTTLTVQDHPLHIGMESLIWQEDLDGPILTLGSQAGGKGYVGPRRRGE